MKLAFTICLLLFFNFENILAFSYRNDDYYTLIPQATYFMNLYEDIKVAAKRHLNIDDLDPEVRMNTVRKSVLKFSPKTFSSYKRQFIKYLISVSENSRLFIKFFKNIKN